MLYHSGGDFVLGVSFRRGDFVRTPCAITAVEPTEKQRSGKRLEDGRRDEVADAAKLTPAVLRSSLTLSGRRQCWTECNVI